MASFTTTFFGLLFLLLAVVGAYIYLFGIPADLKREMEEKALETMGENKASYLMKDAVGMIPETGDRDLNELKRNVGDALGGALKNPLGKFTGNTADDATKDVTGR